MSVPAYKRQLSCVEYINSAMQMAALCTTMYNKVPQKYKYPFEQMLNMSYDALYHLDMANNTNYRETSFVNDYLFKRNNITYGKEEIRTIGCIAEINFGILEANNVLKKRNITHYRENVGRIVDTELKTANGVLNYHAKKFRNKMNDLGMTIQQVNSYPQAINGTGLNAVNQYIKTAPMKTQLVPKNNNNKVSMCKIIDKKSA